MSQKDGEMCVLATTTQARCYIKRTRPQRQAGQSGVVAEPRADVICYNSKKPGHFACKCRKKKDDNSKQGENKENAKFKGVYIAEMPNSNSEQAESRVPDEQEQRILSADIADV
ncbi:hypothetical protein TSAR_006244 [Trichomalopsis sarcophagae]|uniref:CCHC-type domain-containing protein n=1 Tax=Trichomalopsis sarcophagae TaxID=543379 RepID=A0A232EGD7_9HYME|nr:hypothetical protein TSAR_006244 [Trichomalopsis sarcophagae]